MQMQNLFQAADQCSPVECI